MITKIYKFIFAICVVCGMASCSDFFDQESEHVIFAEENHLDNSNDSIYSVIGVLNKLQAIADRTVLLGEVRGDLVDITATANSDLRDMALFDMGDDNRYNQPRDYYAIINNCNYFIENVDTAMKNNRNEYIFMREYTAIKAIRAWTYLQLVLNYGSVPFVTKPILSKLEAEQNFPKYDLQAICQYFINDLMPLTDRWANEYPQYGNIRDLRDGASRLLFFPVNVVLGDLNLWLASITGSKATYQEAAMRYYKYISQRNGDNSSYPIGMSYYAWESGSSTWDSPRGIISGDWSDEEYGPNTELITIIAGDSIRAEGNYSELRNLFYSREENDYHVSIVPSENLFDLYESQDNCVVGASGTTYSYAPKDLTRHRSGDLRLYYSYDEGERTDRLTGDRFEVSYIDKQAFQHIHIYRRAMVYLRLAEALNGAGYPRAAFSILSTGMNNEVCRSDVYPYYSESDSLWLSQIDFPETRYGLVTVQEYASRNSTENHNTMGLHSRGSGWTPYNEFYQLPGTQKPVIEVDEEEGDEPAEEIVIPKDSEELIQEQQAFVDSLLLNENGLELAFEGTRFYDIMRFAFRQPNPGAFLSNQVCNRRGKENSDLMRGEIKKDLNDQRNWYLRWNGQIGLY